MEKCEVLDIIISFIKSFKNSDSNSRPFIYSTYKGGDRWIWNTDYLINQILRQIDVPPERFLISKKAKELWESITSEDIRKYYYQEKVTAEYDGAVIEEYSGASKTPRNTRTLKKNDSFTYKDVFHHEHMIPIKIIIDELIKLKDDELDYEHVDSILSKIYICRILKSEDRKIKNKYNRSSNIDEVIRDVYSEIEVIR